VDKKRLVGKLYIKSLEQAAFTLELFRVPGLQRQQERAIKIYRDGANKVRKELGEAPKQYLTVKKRKVVPV